MRTDHTVSLHGALRPKGGTVLIVLLLLCGSFAWRIGTMGVADPERILSAVEEELVDTYRQALYAEYRLTGGADARPGEGGTLPRGQLEGLAATFENVGMAASVFRFSANEEVVVRFDYTLHAGGEVRESGTEVYKRVSRRGSSVVWDSGPVSHWLQYVF